jgi:hypothetical protein
MAVQTCLDVELAGTVSENGIADLGTCHEFGMAYPIIFW